MTKLKVLHLKAEKTWRGGEQQIAYLIDELNHLDVENFILARRGSAFEKYCIDKGLVIYSAGYSNPFDLLTAWMIKSACTRNNIDVINMHCSTSHSLAVLSASWFNNHVPLVLNRRVNFRPKNSIITKWKYNHSSIKKIICSSHKINETIQSYIKEPEKSIVVYDGVDLKRFEGKSDKNILREEFNILPNIFLIGNTSALTDEKDYPTFINTIELLSNEKLPIKAFIIGKGLLEDKLKKDVEEKNLNDVIMFTGFRHDIVDILPCLDIFLMTSKQEGLGSSVLDAFLAEVPVVATRAGGIPEMVIHEKTGLLASIGDSYTLANNIRKLMLDENFKNNLVDEAARKVLEFSKESTAKKTLSIYQEVLAKTDR